jgi:hypothetical protein
VNRWTIPIAVAAIVVVVGCALVFSMNDDQNKDPKRSDTDDSGVLTLAVDGKALDVEWKQNASVRTLKALARGVIDVRATNYGGFEQVADLGSALPRDDSRMTSEPGDVFLYMGNQIVLFYGSNDYSYTPLGKIKGMSQGDLAELLGKRSVQITLTVV